MLCSFYVHTDTHSHSFLVIILANSLRRVQLVFSTSYTRKMKVREISCYPRKASWLWSGKAETRIMQVFSLPVWNSFFWILLFHLVWLFNYKILTPFTALICPEPSFHRGLHWRNIRSLKIWFRLWLRDRCQVFAKCFSIIHNSLNMETHCLNIAWENVLWCLVKPEVVYLNTLNFSFSPHKYIQCHPFVSSECFKITLIEICRYSIHCSVGLSNLCCFRVLQLQHSLFPL